LRQEGHVLEARRAFSSTLKGVYWIR
jgi:hypothetical protein